MNPLLSVVDKIFDPLAWLDLPDARVFHLLLVEPIIKWGISNGILGAFHRELATRKAFFIKSLEFF